MACRIAVLLIVPVILVLTSGMVSKYHVQPGELAMVGRGVLVDSLVDQPNAKPLRDWRPTAHIYTGRHGGYGSAIATCALQEKLIDETEAPYMGKKIPQKLLVITNAVDLDGNRSSRCNIFIDGLLTVGLDKARDRLIVQFVKTAGNVRTQFTSDLCTNRYGANQCPSSFLDELNADLIRDLIIGGGLLYLFWKQHEWCRNNPTAPVCRPY